MMNKQENLKNIAIANLTYCRLKADLAAVEMEIAGNQPIANEAEGNFFLATLKRLGIGVKNELRKTTLEDLEKDKALVQAELTRFEEEHPKKELSLANDPAALKAFLKKKLFKKDAYGLEKLQFALSMIIDNRYAYQRPEQSLCIISDLIFEDGGYMQGLYDSLCQNFKYIRMDLSISLHELFSLAPALGNVSLQSWINKSKQKRFTTRIGKLTADQIGAMLAAKLTVVEKAKTLLPKTEWETLADQTLSWIQDFRADAEYRQVFTEDDGSVLQAARSLCKQAINRLEEIVKN